MKDVDFYVGLDNLFVITVTAPVLPDGTVNLVEAEKVLREIAPAQIRDIIFRMPENEIEITIEETDCDN